MNRLEATGMWFSKMILRITKNEHVSNGEVLNKIGKKKHLYIVTERVVISEKKS